MKKLFRPWPRWAKIARNLTVTALLALFIWVCLGAPLTLRGELRRFERQNLLPPGKIVLSSSDDASIPQGLYVSVSDTAMVTFGEGIRWVDFLTGDGPELLPLRTAVMWVSGGKVLSANAYILVHPPEAAARAVITVTGRERSYTAEAVRTDGAFLLVLTPALSKSSEDWWSPGGYSWQAEFYDAQGNLI